jgi:hypothetical protein
VFYCEGRQDVTGNIGNTALVSPGVHMRYDLSMFSKAFPALSYAKRNLKIYVLRGAKLLVCQGHQIINQLGAPTCFWPALLE